MTAEPSHRARELLDLHTAKCGDCGHKFIPLHKYQSAISHAAADTEARIVAWLREKAAGHVGLMERYDRIADAIEHGEHRHAD